MRRVMLFSKSWRSQHEKSRMACGLIHGRCRRGSGGREPVEAAIVSGMEEAMQAELCPNEKVVDVHRFFDGHGNSFQSHPIMWAHPDHFHRDPGRVNPCHYRQPDVDKGLLVFQP
jgi:hypothetical protein